METKTLVDAIDRAIDAMRTTQRLFEISDGSEAIEIVEEK